jgi:hypothetical protein
VARVPGGGATGVDVTSPDAVPPCVVRAHAGRPAAGLVSLPGDFSATSAEAREADLRELELTANPAERAPLGQRLRP